MYEFMQPVDDGFLLTFDDVAQIALCDGSEPAGLGDVITLLTSVFGDSEVASSADAKTGQLAHDKVASANAEVLEWLDEYPRMHSKTVTLKSSLDLRHRWAAGVARRQCISNHNVASDTRPQMRLAILRLALAAGRPNGRKLRLADCFSNLATTLVAASVHSTIGWPLEIVAR